MQHYLPELGLSPGERFFIWRKRNGHTIVQAATLYKTHKAKIQEWERDGSPPPEVDLSSLITLAEYCTLLRRRAGLTQPQLAEKVGCSKVWVVRMERGLENPAKLIEYWKNTEWWNNS